MILTFLLLTIIIFNQFNLTVKKYFYVGFEFSDHALILVYVGSFIDVDMILIDFTVKNLNYFFTGFNIKIHNQSIN